MTEPLWWQSGTIYQIYPRSFQDSNGDGIGDLAGIRARLDELVELGVDAIWISPIFPSPQADFGYDVADYTGIDPRFGTFGDFDALLKAAHDRGLKLLLDFVPNHSSNQHPWFRESRASRDNPKRDWYIWRDAGPDGAPPNNWISDFGGSAWEWDEATGQYYYHGAYDLGDDEALLIEVKVPERCRYWSIILTNHLYVTTDWSNHQSSLNDSQARIDSDGVLRAVVSARDPGVPNWIDTAGYPEGLVQGRWFGCAAAPIPNMRKLALSKVRAAVPADTPLVSPDRRERLIRERRAALQQRPMW